MEKKILGLNVDLPGLTVLLSGIFLLVFAILFFQVAKMNAGQPNLRGTLILLDKPPIQWTGQGYLHYGENHTSSVSLPGTLCNVQLTACVYYVTTGGVNSPAIYFNGHLNSPGGSMAMHARQDR